MLNYLCDVLICFYLSNCIFSLGDKCDVQILEDVDRNADPTSSYSPKVRWNIDECHEVVVLLSRKNPRQ